MFVFFRRLCGCALVLVFGAWLVTAVVVGAGSSAGEPVSATVASLESVSIEAAFFGLCATLWIISSIAYGTSLAWRATPQRLASTGILVFTTAFVALAIVDRLARAHGPVHLSTDINAYVSMLLLTVAVVVFAAIVDLTMPPWPASTQWPQSQE